MSNKFMFILLVVVLFLGLLLVFIDNLIVEDLFIFK